MSEMRPGFLQFLEIWFEKSGSRNLVREIWFQNSGWPKKRWFYTIDLAFFQVGEKWLTRKKIGVWRTTFLEPLFNTFPEMRSQNKRSIVWCETAHPQKWWILKFEFWFLVYNRSQPFFISDWVIREICKKNQASTCSA